MALEEKDANDGASQKPSNEGVTPSNDNNKQSAENQKIADLEKKLEALVNAQALVQQPIQSGITPEQLEAILSRVSAGQRPDVSIGENEFTYVEEANIDEDDFLEEGHVFWHHAAGTVIVDDKRNGQSVMTPLKTKIVFEYVSTKKIGTGRDIQLQLLSKYISHSKKEVEWLKSHTGYNVVFFDDIKNNSMGRQAKKAARLNSMLVKVRKMDKTQLYNALKIYKIPFSKDFEVMYLALAEVYVEAELLQDKQKSEEIARNHAIEQKMVEDLTS